jgi:hypothetical protein
MNTGPRLHLRSIHYLPSWQGGDRELPRCRVSRLGFIMPDQPTTALMTDQTTFVGCPACRRLINAGRAQA